MATIKLEIETLRMELRLMEKDAEYAADAGHYKATDNIGIEIMATQYRINDLEKIACHLCRGDGLGHGIAEGFTCGRCLGSGKEPGK